MEDILNFIGGEFVPAYSGTFIDNYAPAKGAVYSRVADSGAEDLARAIEAAHAAQGSWAGLSMEVRANFLYKMADAIDESARELALVESIDTGKPLNLASKLDIPRASANLRFFAGAALHFASECHPSGDGVLNYTRRDPLGLVACISPWNLPLYLLTWKIAPALVLGNTVIAKPTEVCPMSAQYLAKIAQKIGLPAGVLSVLHGRGSQIGQLICESPAVKAVSFTGGTKTGAQIAKTVAPSFKKLSLELGGKNPVVVFADCDFTKAVETTARAAFTNQGQICLCGSRILVQRSIYERFRDALVAKTRALHVGDPLAKECDQGAVVSREHLEKILSYVDLAKKEGGRLLCGGERVSVSAPYQHGYFMAPTLMEGLDSKSPCLQEEIFGPVAMLIPFDDESEALRLANDSQYGLCASVWTSDVNRAHRLAHQIEAGVVWINSWMLRDLRIPFGGVKQSGIGREGGWESLKFFSQVKNVCLNFS